jgi:hypothetical protein
MNSVEGKLCRQMTVQRVYEDARKAEDGAETISENANAKVVEAKKVLENLEQSAADAVKSSVLKVAENARGRARERRTFQNFELRERAASSKSKFPGE